MKILLTIVVCNEADREKAFTLYDGIELIYPEEGEKERDFLSRAFKIAKGKYSLVCVNRFRFADVQSILNILDKNTADMVSFLGGSVLKTSIIKNIAKDCPDEFSACALAIMQSKTMLKTVYTPFIFDKGAVAFNDENTEGMLLAAAEFKKVKAKLSKEIYSYVFEMLCARIVEYYIFAMLSIRDGKIEAEKLISFDNKLKAEIVLYLAVDKRFEHGNLEKLRNKGFKISFFTAKRFRKLIKYE